MSDDPAFPEQNLVEGDKDFYGLFTVIPDPTPRWRSGLGRSKIPKKASDMVKS